MSLPSGEMASSFQALSLKGAVIGRVTTNFVRGCDAGGEDGMRLQIARLVTIAVRATTPAVIAHRRGPDCTVLYTPIGETVVGSSSASFISIRTLAM